MEWEKARAEALAALKQAILDEREACAEIAKEGDGYRGNDWKSEYDHGWDAACDYIERAIRARTEKGK